MATLGYDPSAGSIMLVTDQGTLEYDGCGPDLEFCRQGNDGREEQALWLNPDEAAVLAKMVTYCLTKLERLSPASRQVLEVLQPRVDAIARDD
jgi:hypothetical protein